MSAKANPEMLVLAREYRGLTQTTLANAASLNQATISRYESGFVEIPPEHVEVLAVVLERPQSFFYWHERLYDASCFHHRKLKALPVRELKRIHACVNLLRMQAARLLRYAKVRTAYTFHQLDMTSQGGPDACAAKLRHLWQLPTGPIRSVVNAIEGAGGVVFRYSFDTRMVDGISQWALGAAEAPPVFFVNDESPGDRERWTLCHEIGHMVMHHMPTSDPEGEANRFASEFLMPAKEVKSELANMTLQKAAALKSHWKVSMQAIIYRARELGKITKEHYDYLIRQVYAKKYNKCEPVPIPVEEPALFRELVRVQQSAFRRTTKEVAEFLGELENNFRSDYWITLGGIRLLA
jgi:Zn-dependent peptidase ImmA (M78 family)/transcriptional regulator with XRE-family HTH domain